MNKNIVFEDKVERLKARISDLVTEDVMLAFSGGVDSSLLLKLACRAAERTGRQVFAVLFHSRLHPAAEEEAARLIAEEAGAQFRVVRINELLEAGIEDNPKDRCYRCKRYLFQTMKEEAQKLGISRLMEGTNADDLLVYRPGIRAVRELGIQSPLAEAGMTKEEVRKLAFAYGMVVSKKPSVPCLATRFPYGTELTYEAMRKVDEAEQYLKGLGFYNVRVRVYGELIRIEVDLSEIGRLVREKEEVTRRMKELGYRYVTADLEGFRSGSMDI